MNQIKSDQAVGQITPESVFLLPYLRQPPPRIYIVLTISFDTNTATNTIRRKGSTKALWPSKASGRESQTA